jgi:hypothetical protein
MPPQYVAPNILILGSLNTAHIEILGLPGFDKQITVQDGIDSVADPRTTWRSVESLRSELDPDQLLPFRELHLTEMTGFFCWPENYMEDGTLLPVAVFFYHPPELTPEEALKLIEIRLHGELSPSLAVGLLSIAPYFANKANEMNGLGIGFVLIAGSIPAHGISYLSDQSIRERVNKFIGGLEGEGAPLEQYLPDPAVDRAKFMVELAESCWRPELRRKIAHSFNSFEYIAPLMFIARSWLYLNPKKTVQVAEETIVPKGNVEEEIDPWLQCLEWDAHDIHQRDLQFLLPYQHRFGENFIFYYSPGYPDEVNLVASELTKKILDDSYTKPVYIPDYFRVELPDYLFFEYSRIHGFRICGNAKSGLWVGLETPSGNISASFWWQPQTEIPLSWITGGMNPKTRALIHLTLACLWRDMTNRSEEDFPVQHQAHYTGIDAYSWGRPEEIQEFQEETWLVIRKAVLYLDSASKPEDAQTILSLAKDAYSTRPNMVGRACLELFLQACRPPVVEF